jgi:hypothetical protein
MDNLSCIEFLILIYNWIIEDIEEQNQPQPVYIEMQPMAPRVYKTESPQKDIPLIRQRKHVFAESPEASVAAPPEQEPKPILELSAKIEDTFETDFEIIEIADLIKED